MFSGASNARDTPNISKNMIYILPAQLINEGMSLQREREREQKSELSVFFPSHQQQWLDTRHEQSRGLGDWRDRNLRSQADPSHLMKKIQVIPGG